MIHFSNIELYQSVSLQLAAVLLVAKVIAYMNFLKTRRYVQAKWVQAVKRYWDGPTASSMLCSKHFEQDC